VHVYIDSHFCCYKEQDIYLFNSCDIVRYLIIALHLSKVFVLITCTLKYLHHLIVKTNVDKYNKRDDKHEMIII